MGESRSGGGFQKGVFKSGVFNYLSNNDDERDHLKNSFVSPHLG